MRSGPVQSRAQLLEHAARALRMKQFGDAERLALEVLKASKTDTAAVAILSQALIAQNRAGEAIARLEKTARRSSDSGIETLLGAALFSAGRRVDAIEQLRRTAARRPPFIPAFRELAAQLAGDGRLEEAIAAIESALALAPQNVDLQLDLGFLHLQRNDRGKARAILQQAQEATPGRFDILTALARAMLLDGDYTAAAHTYRRALDLRPDDAMTRANLATCLLEMGDRDAGEASLRLALRGRPQLLGQSISRLVLSSHGRFFFRRGAAAKFLQGESK
jgi:tetratricopeptide (TPR) repeat protein